MGVRTVRLDNEAEKALEQIRRLAGLSISGTFKRGLLLLRDDLVQKAQRTPYDIYAELNLGPDGYATAPSTAAILPRIAFDAAIATTMWRSLPEARWSSAAAWH
ncbi:MAG: hypothetical protein ACRERE_01330 [Candidatus Entotheonellia bacterium]